MPPYNNIEESKLTSDTSIALWTDLLSKKSKLWLPVLSGSMLPLFHIGDKVLVQSINPDKIKVGHIVVFTNQDKLIFHMIIRKFNNNSNLSFLQKGDATINAEIIRSEDIIGKVTAIRKRNRTICLNDRIWRVINHILTLFSFSVYYLKPKNRFLKMPAKFCYHKTRSLFNYVIRK